MSAELESPLPEPKGEEDEEFGPPEPIAFAPRPQAARAPELDVYRLPPHDLDAERALLGSVLIDPAAMVDALELVAPADFYRQSHAMVFRAMSALYGEGQAPDVVTVAAQLERTGDLEAAGGAAYLATLGIATPTAIHVAQYARIVADRARERATIRAAGRITEAAYQQARDLPERIAEIVAGLPRAAIGEPTARLGTRTAADLRHGIPPDQLAEPYCTPEGAVVLYARGGTGKGLVTCWLIKRLVAARHVVMIIDFEGHEREWGSRLRGLGMTEDELAHVHYRAPFASDWTAPTGSLATVADAIRDDAARLGVTYLIIDSYSVATSNGDTMGGEAAAREYFSGLARIGLPSWTIAHVRGDSGKFPDRPFGSVFVHNLARETWAVERVGDEEPETDPDLIDFGPHVVALELRNRKSNARPTSAAQFVTFSFFGDGTIEVATDRPGGRSVADLAADALAEGPMALAAIAKAIKEDTGEAVLERTVRTTLKRHSQRFIEATSGRPRTWSLR